MATFGKFLIFDEELGSGGYGTVFRGKNSETGELVAVKVMNTESMPKKAILREVQLMQALKHPHIIRLHDFQELGDRVCIFMELAPKGELFSRVIENGCLQEPDTRRYFSQIMGAIEYLHGVGVAHRDLKLENVIIGTNDDCKVCDFGLAHVYPRDASGKLVVPREVLRDVCGSRSYAAPEVLGERGYDGFSADCWSCGICLFAMLAGFFPLDGATSSDWRFVKVSEAVLLGRSLTHTVFGFYNRPCVLSDEVADLIDGLLSLNPSTRLTVADVFSHQWMTGLQQNNTDDLKPIRNGRQQNTTDDLNSAESGRPRYRSATFCENSLGLGMQMTLSGGALQSDAYHDMPVYRGINLVSPNDQSSMQPPALLRQHAFGVRANE